MIIYYWLAKLLEWYFNPLISLHNFLMSKYLKFEWKKKEKKKKNEKQKTKKKNK